MPGENLLFFLLKYLRMTGFHMLYISYHILFSLFFNVLIVRSMVVPIRQQSVYLTESGVMTDLFVAAGLTWRLSRYSGIDGA